MWNYEKRLEYPINIKKTDPRAAQVIISQYGGPDGELSASMRYLSQRFSMTDRRVAGVLTDIGVSVAKLRIWNETCSVIEVHVFFKRLRKLQFPELSELSITSMLRMSVV